MLAIFLLLVVPIFGLYSGNAPFTYQAKPGASVASISPPLLTNSSYALTGFGGGESTIHVGTDGALIYLPAFSNKGVGYAASYDYGKTWSQVLPAPKDMGRLQIWFQIADGRYFYWASGSPGLTYSYSDDQGKTWNTTKHFHPEINDWTRMAAGRPVHSSLSGGATQVLYMASPTTLDIPIPELGLGPISELIWKSTDRGTSWELTKGSPSLKPELAGGSCGDITPNSPKDEMIIWGTGIVRTNGTVMFGVRKCAKLNVVVSDDEGDSWRFIEIPGSSMAVYKDKTSYFYDGNILAADPLSQDADGTLYTTWVADDYALKLSVSKDGGATWTSPVIIAAPGGLMTYHPSIAHHPKQAGRAGLVYYGSSDAGKSWHGYLAETENLAAVNPTFSSVIVNRISEPLQHNFDGHWDQGYYNALWDAVEFTGVKYHPETGDLLGAFAKKMCTDDFVSSEKYNVSSCLPGWDFRGVQAESPWQGFVAFGHHNS